MRYIPTDHPATPSLHVGNASLKRKITTWVEVARPKRSADMENGALLGREMRRYHDVETDILDL
jgi:L-arabinose isomerase